MYAHKAKAAALENQALLHETNQPVEYNLNVALYCIAESLEYLEREIQRIKQTVERLERQ